MPGSLRRWAAIALTVAAAPATAVAAMSNGDPAPQGQGGMERMMQSSGEQRMMEDPAGMGPMMRSPGMQRMMQRHAGMGCGPGAARTRA